MSDLHLDYKENRQWMMDLSDQDYRSDWLILAGDISDDVGLIDSCFSTLAAKFAKVFFVPGNHDLWVRRDKSLTSLDKFHTILQRAADHGAITHVFSEKGITIVPLFGWYDYSFGPPSAKLLQGWMDYRLCRWPHAMTPEQTTDYFLRMNMDAFRRFDETPGAPTPTQSSAQDVVISFSHFLPRIDVMPSFVSPKFHFLYPVLGSSAIDRQSRMWTVPRRLHIYGHSHVNRSVVLDGIHYINNAFGYPSEQKICRKKLLCIHGDGADLSL